MFLSPYLHPKLSSLYSKLCKSLCVNAGCVLVYIPSPVGGAYVYTTVLQKSIQAMHSEVAPYITPIHMAESKCGRYVIWDRIYYSQLFIGSKNKLVQCHYSQMMPQLPVT